jgi:hypothetical protein
VSHPAHSNEIRLFRDGDKWCALIGPNAAEGIMGWGFRPDSALHDLAALIGIGKWECDPDWHPHSESRSHKPEPEKPKAKPKSR